MRAGIAIVTAAFPPGCHPATRAVRAGIDSDAAHGAVVPPIVLSSNFSFEGFDRKRRYDYTRSGNPTRDQLAAAIADLEGAAGMAACTLALGPKLVWVETPSNPLLRITDLRHVCEAAHRAGALVLADNTFLSPALQRPIGFGADLVLHSTTKYINGHSDVVGGALVARDPALVETISWWANALGLAGSPFDSFLALRGLRTLDARLRVHQDNTACIATLLQSHPAVAAVHYPGMPSHPQHALAARQQDGFGAMLSLDLAGGEPAARAFVDGLRCFTLAESLGGVESLIAHPATMTHASMSADARAAAGIGNGLLRLSIGIEHADDLIADLSTALDRSLAVSDSREVAAV